MRKKIKHSAIWVLCGLTLLWSGRGQAQTNRILVKLQPHISLEQSQQLMALSNARMIHSISQIGVQVWQLPPQANTAAVTNVLSHRPEVLFTEPDTIAAPDTAVPNDPLYSSQWHLPRINAPLAWNQTIGASNVIIAILDTGVDGTHPDLASKIVPGWNTFDNNADTSDVYGHGTAVAGSATASGGNGLGIASVAWNCRLMPIRISDLNGMGYSSTIASGLTWAADHGARVANISYNVDTSSTVSSAAQYFMSKGGVISMSAGNNASYFANPDNPYILTVSATDSADNRASFSNSGTNIDIAAPGVSIYTTNRGGGYGAWSGTSFSAPIVAGVAALVISANPSLGAQQVCDILKQSSDDLGTAGWDAIYGWGRLNAERAVNTAIATTGTGSGAGSGADTQPPTISISSFTARISNSLSVSATATDNIAVVKVELRINGSLFQTDTSGPWTFSVNTRKWAAGTYSVQCTAYDAAGNSTLSQVVTVTK